MKKHNFNPGPSHLPETVCKQAAEAVVDLHGSGLSVLEISHRSPDFTDIIHEAQDLVKSLYSLDDSYKVLFLQGGASTQFAMVPYNFLGEGELAAYINTGSWSKKAIKEAGLFGKVDVIASSEESNFNYIPKDYSIPSDAKYLHITTNNTIYGTQYHAFPSGDVPLVADMSSDIFCRDLDMKQFDLVYAGAQKNLGPAGVTLVILKDPLFTSSGRAVPTMLDYNTHIKKESLFNTPPVFAIYASLLTLRWIRDMGGLAKMEESNRRKASMLYDEIDSNPLFKGTAAKEDRSMMNVTFVMEDPGMEKEFMQMATEHDIVGIKGHRSVGGFRASIYNAVEEESVSLLTGLMKKFAMAKA